MNKIVEMKFGSHLYGTNTENSDLDLKGIYIPTAREIVLGNYKKTITTSRPKAEKERNTKDDVDVEVFSLDRFLELLMDGQTVALDVLFSPDFVGNPITDKIFENKDKLLTKNINAFVGYARQQAAKYGIKGSRLDALEKAIEFLDMMDYHSTLLENDAAIRAFVERSNNLVSLEKTPLVEVVNIKAPNGNEEPHLHICGRKVPFHAKVSYAKEVFGRIHEGYGQRAHKAHLAGGVDWKALSHAVRVNGEALELLQTGKITFPRPDRELLLAIKLGQLEYDEVAMKIEEGLVFLTEAYKVSTLREAPDKQWAQDLVYEVYSEVVRGTKDELLHL